MVAWWKEMGRPLAAFFADTPLRKISPADLTAYQNARRDLGRAPKTVNSELSVLRQILKYAKLWYRFAEDYKALKNTKPPVVKRSPITTKRTCSTSQRPSRHGSTRMSLRPSTSSVASARVRIKGLQWKHVSWDEGRLAVRRSKTPAGWREPSLNDTCLTVLRELHHRGAARFRAP
jgi:hypothetical protein